MGDLRMPFINKWVGAGRLTRDPVMSYVGDQGTPLCKFGIACNRKWKGKDGTEHEEVFFGEVSLWNKAAEWFNGHASKGTPVLVEGRMVTESWEKDGERKSRTGITAEKVHLLEWDSHQSGVPAGVSSGGYSAPEGAVAEDDCPF